MSTDSENLADDSSDKNHHCKAIKGAGGKKDLAFLREITSFCQGVFIASYGNEIINKHRVLDPDTSALAGQYCQ